MVILFLSLQRKEYSKIDVIRNKEKIIYLSYNTISIKQIDSLSSTANLKFSELLAEKIEIN